MEMCRACLATGVEMMPMDENFIKNYNNFTNLNLTMMDMPLYTCRTCFDGAKFCVEFRDKCIKSDRTLREALLPSNKLEVIKEESDDEKLLTVKKEIKTEPSDDEAELLDECYNYGEDYVKPSVKPKPQRDRLCKVKKKAEAPVDSNLHCGICPKILKSPAELTSHLEQHKSEFACSLCQESLLSEPHMLGHRMTHVPHQQKRCHLCSRRFISSENLEFHCMRVHEMAEKDAQIQCKMCLAPYSTVKKLQKHICLLAERKYKCDHCTKSFRHHSSLKVHMGNHTSKRFTCDLCDYTSKYSQGIYAHKLRKHTVGKAICKTCGRTFASQQLLDKHECRHRLPVVCPVCGITYQAKGKHSYDRHMKTHEDAPQFKCSQCPATFRSRSNFSAHKDRHAGTPRHRCEHCDRGFYSQSVLIKHRRTHTGEKPYVCEICSRGFTGNHNLKVHMKVHGVVNLIRKKNLEDEESVDK